MCKVFVLACSMIIATQAGAAVETSVLTLPTKNGKVTLNHLKHQKVNKGCRACHENDYGGQIQGLNMSWAHKKCVGCHEVLRKGPRECINCHDSRRG